MNINLADLEFILEQIKTGEAHAAGTPQSIRALVGDPLLPFGVRTVDGTYNNLIIGREAWGAADRMFPQLTKQFFRPGENITFDPDGPAGPAQPGQPTNYWQNGGFVFDSQPRVISNLISDQTITNPAAVSAWNPADDVEFDGETLVIPNVSPDLGLSSPFNSWFTLFGQFFDHGLDLANKGGGTIFIPLKADDPLIAGADGIFGNGDDLPLGQRFMPLTRLENDQILPGPDGQLNTADDIHRHTNQTTSHVDQNQTYTSHPSHQAFLREYELNAAGDPVSTGHMLEGTGGGLATWADIKLQAREMLGIELTDADVLDVPQLVTDEYGQFVRGPNGYALLVTEDGVIEGNPAAPISTANALRTGHAFLDDIAHTANPLDTRGALRTADGDDAINPIVPGPAAGQFDNELLEAHYITGDGRGNENIGLTTVHHVFHAEHNRLVEQIKADLLATNDPTLLAEWQLAPASGDTPAVWNGERLFQAARFGTEMQYQHLVFEEFARKIQPQVDVFAGYDVTIDPAITAEFAHTVYRFGHSMLTGQVDRVNDNGVLTEMTLIDAFLNPVGFANSGVDATDAAEAIVRGMTQQTGNAIDEFIAEGVRNNLVGLPLDLGAINIARGRDAGVPSLNAARKQFFDATSDSALAPYTSWADFQTGIKHAASLVNFIAAYGTHATITGATTMAAKRAAAQALVTEGSNATSGDAYEFLNATGAHAGGSLGGLNNVDFWIGGLAEKTAPFGGMLGSSFNFVFETQMEKLQDGDRMYYLARTAGLNFLTELENNTFADIVMRNLPGVKHLPADIFIVPDQTFELDDPTTWNEAAGVTSNGVNLRYVGGEHVVIGGTDANNDLRADEGDDTVYGDGGNDRIEGGAGNDSLVGGDGDDIITDSFGDDNIKGGDGDDAINAGLGADLVIAGPGGDFVVAAGGLQETFAGSGNDFVRGGTSTDIIIGNEGDDWIEGGGSADDLAGDNFDPFEASKVLGNDVMKGDGGNDSYEGESGDDIMVSGSGAERYEGMLGYDWVTHYLEPDAADADLLFDVLPPNVPIPPAETNADRFNSIEAISGWNLDDTLRGDDRGSADLALVEDTTGFNNALNNAQQINLIDGLADLLGGAGVTSFSGGNIMLGGGGSDFIEGREGDDILNGDAWLRVQLEHGGNRYDSMSQLQAGVFARTILPRDISIVREIVFASGAAAGDDRLDGGVGNDTLNAGEGNNVVIGGTGDDRIDVSAGNDRLVLQAPGFGNDRVTGFDFDGGALTSQDMIDVSGFIGADDITAANFLNEVSIAGAGADTVVTIGADTITLVGVAAAGVTVADFILDGPPEPEPPPPPPTTIESASSYTLLASDPPNLTLTLNANINGVGDGRANILTGNSGNNILNGLGGNDELIGNAGNDTLNGGTGADNMSGGVGNDTYVVENIGDVITELEGEGTDTLQSSLSVTALVTNVENLVLAGTANLNGTGNDANNVITGNGGVNLLRGGIGNDTLNGAGGNDRLIGGAGNDTLNVSSGNDTIEFLAVGFGADTVVGFDAVADAAGQDLIDLRNFDGADDITATNFADRVVITEEGADTLVTIGVDTIRLTGVALANVTGADFIVDGGPVPEPPPPPVNPVLSATTRTLAEGEGPDLTLTGADNIDGTGNSVANIITGNTGNNVLTGLGGADTFALLNGGNDTVVLGAGSGADLVTGFDAEGGSGQQDLVDLRGFADINADNFETSVTFSATGAGNADTLVTITGGSSVTLAGVAVAALNASDFIVNPGAIVPPPPPNPVLSDTTRTLAEDEGPDLTLTGAANINGTGNSVANIITGNSGNNVLTGLGGADTFALLSGGNDTIVLGAGSGADLVTDFDAAGGTGQQDLIDLRGFADITTTDFADDVTFSATGAGNADTLVTIVGGSTVTLAGVALASVDITDFIVNPGVVVPPPDPEPEPGLVLSSTTRTLAAGEGPNLTLTGTANINGTGNDVANVITGNSGNNVIDGRRSADSMSGGLGDDTYFIDVSGDVVTEAANGGTDTVRTTISHTLGANFENLTLIGAAGSGTGNALNNVIVGNASNNTLNGAAGDDRLEGAAGNDTLNASLGNDVLVFRAPGFGADRVLGFDADATDAQDLIDFSAYAGAADINAGNFASRVAIVDAGADTRITMTGTTDSILLVGVGDHTTVSLASGDFILDVGAPAPAPAPSPAPAPAPSPSPAPAPAPEPGLVLSDTTRTLAAGEGPNLTLTGTANINGTGNDVANVITGNSGNNVIDGRRAADNMSGGLGDDTYFIDVSGDVVTEAANAGTDTVRTTISHTLGANFENLTLIGAAGSGTGNALNNVIVGNASNNTLNGAAGDDRLEGAAGNDTLNASLGNDVLVFRAPGFGDDRVLGFDADAAGLQDLIDFSAYAGAADITAANFADRVSITDAGADTLITMTGTTDSILLVGVGDPTTVSLTSGDFLLG